MNPAGTSAPFLAVDLGKTSCRVGIGHDRSTRALSVRGDGPGAVGLAEPNGPRASLNAVTSQLDPSTRHALEGADACVAAAGYVPGDWSVDLGEAFVKALGLASCAVTSDAIAAHVGACGGGPGAVLSAGTGSVAVAVSPEGRVRLVDGVGQWLGDDGSGAWIGLEGLRAALRARDGRGPETLLERLAGEAFGDLETLPRTLSQSGNVAQAAAAFAGAVCAAADTDAAAASIIDTAARSLARTALAAVRHAGMPRIILVGGLRELGPRLLDPWRAITVDAGVDILEPLGTALDGAARLAIDRTLPHEVAVTRVESPTSS
jgi:glucosamine kinase